RLEGNPRVAPIEVVIDEQGIAGAVKDSQDTVESASGVLSQDRRRHTIPRLQGNAIEVDVSGSDNAIREGHGGNGSVVESQQGGGGQGTVLQLLAVEGAGRAAQGTALLASAELRPGPRGEHGGGPRIVMSHRRENRGRPRPADILESGNRFSKRT